MRESVWLRVKTYSYLKDNNNEDKEGKDRKKGATKKKLKFQDYKNCLEAAQVQKKIKNWSKRLKEDKTEFIKNNKLKSIMFLLKK